MTKKSAEETFENVKKVFERKYPGITVEYYALSPPEVVGRIQAEYNTGKYLVDSFISNIWHNMSKCNRDIR